MLPPGQPSHVVNPTSSISVSAYILKAPSLFLFPICSFLLFLSSTPLFLVGPACRVVLSGRLVGSKLVERSPKLEKRRRKLEERRRIIKDQSLSPGLSQMSIFHQRPADHIPMDVEWSSPLTMFHYHIIYFNLLISPKGE